MKNAIISTLLLAPLVAVSSVAIGQVNPPPTQTQELNNTDTQNREAQNPDAVHKGQHRYYRTLDRGSKGYLSLEDVSGDAFLSQNFGNCDVDHDGKLTWEEFKSCTRNNVSQR